MARKRRPTQPRTGQQSEPRYAASSQRSRQSSRQPSRSTGTQQRTRNSMSSRTTSTQRRTEPLSRQSRTSAAPRSRRKNRQSPRTGDVQRSGQTDRQVRTSGAQRTRKTKRKSSRPRTGQPVGQPYPSAPQRTTPVSKRRRQKQRTSRSVRARRRTKRLRVLGVLFRLLFVIVLSIAGVMALTVFFKVETIQINGSQRYPAAQLQKTLGVQQGDNLFLWGQHAAVQKLETTYPYIESIQIHRKLPDTLVIDIKESAPVAVIEDNGQYWLIDRNGKLLENITVVQAQEYPPIVGVQVGKKKVGDTLHASGDETTLVLLQFLRALSESDRIGRMSFLNLTRLYEIHMGYDGKYNVNLGTSEDLQHKLKFLDTIIDEKLSPSDIGTIDLSDGSAGRFQPDTAENIEAAAGRQPLPAEEADTSAADTAQTAEKDTNEASDTVTTEKTEAAEQDE